MNFELLSICVNCLDSIYEFSIFSIGSCGAMPSLFYIGIFAGYGFQWDFLFIHGLYRIWRFKGMKIE